MNAQQNQLDCVTKSKRGGKREHAGAKLKHGEPTAVIRLPVSVIEMIKSGKFESVTNSDIVLLKHENDKLLLQLKNIMGSAHNWVAELEECKSALKINDRQYLESLAIIEGLKNELETEKLRKPNSEQCQFIRSNGDFCTRKSSKSLKIQNLNVSLCGQHFKELSKS